MPTSTRITGLTDQNEELALLAKELGYLPLALTQAAAYIRRQQIDVSSYRSTFKQRGQEMLSQKERGYPGTVATTWLISMEKVTQEDPHAVDLLHLCSYLAPDRIPEKVLSAWLDKKHKRPLGLDFHDALRLLESYALIDQKVEQKEGTHQKWISIHRLIQMVTRDQCDPTEAKDTVELGIDVVASQFRGEVQTQQHRHCAKSSRRLERG